MSRQRRAGYLHLLLYLTDVDERSPCMSVSPEPCDGPILPVEEQLAQLAVGETVILLIPHPIPRLETTTEGRGWYSRVTVSLTARLSAGLWISSARLDLRSSPIYRSPTVVTAAVDGTVTLCIR